MSFVPSYSDDAKPEDLPYEERLRRLNERNNRLPYGVYVAMNSDGYYTLTLEYLTNFSRMNGSFIDEHIDLVDGNMVAIINEGGGRRGAPYYTFIFPKWVFDKPELQSVKSRLIQNKQYM